ncbi:hypothetical protein HMPREF1551_01783 [Capnocytophaga sp. oral taxon 863 str. F0517]|nr:hypothetical protein HMPREF1551_01783 [Capnocytophaga sp. oral taxon 863 str. F0517]
MKKPSLAILFNYFYEFPRWCELAARTPIRQFHPKVIKKTFSFSGYSLSKVRSI